MPFGAQKGKGFLVGSFTHCTTSALGSVQVPPEEAAGHH